MGGHNVHRPLLPQIPDTNRAIVATGGNLITIRSEVEAKNLEGREVRHHQLQKTELERGKAPASRGRA